MSWVLDFNAHTSRGLQITQHMTLSTRRERSTAEDSIIKTRLLRNSPLISTPRAAPASCLYTIQMNLLSLEDKSPPRKQTCELQTWGGLFLLYLSPFRQAQHLGQKIIMYNTPWSSARHQIDSFLARAFFNIFINR